MDLGDPTWHSAAHVSEHVMAQEDEGGKATKKKRCQRALPLLGEHGEEMTPHVTPHDTITQKNAEDSFPRKTGWRKRGEERTSNFPSPLRRKAQTIQAKTVLIGLPHDVIVWMDRQSSDEQSPEQSSAEMLPASLQEGPGLAGRLLSSHSPAEQSELCYEG